jgi:glycosyltransferase involved in cell wall biosynthesis
LEAADSLDHRRLKIRLAIVTTLGGAPWGGSEALWSLTASDALRAGHHVKIFALHTLTSDRLVELQRAGAALSRRRFLAGPRANALYYRFRSAWRDLKRFAPDVVLINQAGTYDCALSREGRQLIALLAHTRIPHVVVSHANYEMNVPPWPVRQAARSFFATASRSAFVSQRNIEIAERQLASRLANAAVVRNPVNLSQNSALPWPDENALRFAHVARIEPAVKGHDLLLEALGTPPWRDRNWKLDIFGDGPDLEYVRELIRYFNLDERVSLKGHVSDVRSVWADHHMLILPSRTEAAPLVIVEAMLCGRPVVATDVGAVREWVTDGETGFVAPAATVVSLSEALERAWAARSSWKQMGERAHAAATALHDPAPGTSLLKLLADATAARAK